MCAEVPDGAPKFKDVDVSVDVKIGVHRPTRYTATISQLETGFEHSPCGMISNLGSFGSVEIPSLLPPRRAVARESFVRRAKSSAHMARAPSGVRRWRPSHD